VAARPSWALLALPPSKAPKLNMVYGVREKFVPRRMS
jgi:hypothetical protein